ncbi:hypothetical protein FNF31_06910 [Cafeteria roenbergensis]|uniref:Uncharacterized protein n=1 Tax=Cafeteria roenbergensis TaxID=33653 RepID=A0A5A8CDM8_CAFRO|nr:hypothetical protein FNF31_06910 [Cafeteria roenbergensis]
MAASGMDPGTLVEAAVTLLKTYRPAVDTVDSHVRSALGAYDESCESDRLLLQQVFYGCQRHRKELRVLLSALFFNRGAHLNRADHHRITALAYLLLFRLDEMGWARVKPLLASQGLNRVHILLRFLLDRDMTSTWLVEDWSKTLDRSFVVDKMLGGLYRAEPDITKWLAATHAAAFGGGEGGSDTARSGAGGQSRGEAAGDGSADAAGAGAAAAAGAAAGAATAAAAATGGHPKRGVTRPVSPNITKPRPRFLPEPARIEATVKARPIPASLNATSLQQLQAEADDRRRRAREQAAGRAAAARAPRLHATRNTTDKARAEQEARLSAELQFEGVPARGVPALPEEGANVRLNAAAVTREEYVLRRRREEEAALVRRFEAELRDGAEFHQWQAEMRARDEEERLLAVARRKEEMEASAANAKAAVSRDLQAKQELAEAVRRRRAVGEELARERRREDEVACRAIADEVRKVRETAPREAEAAVAAARAAAAAAERERAAEAAAEAAALRAAEAAEAADRIRRLRAEDEVPLRSGSAAGSGAPFDPTWTAGHGLLDEMSLQEARERLAATQAAEAEAEERRRQDIIVARRNRQAELERKMETIRSVRSSAAAVSQHARERRAASAAEAAAAADRARADAAVALEARLRAKRAARDAESRALAETAARSAKQQAFLGAAKAASDERRHHQLRINREAAAARASERAVSEHKAQERTMRLEAGERARSRRSARRAQHEVRSRAAEALRVGRAELEREVAGETAAKKEAFLATAAREERLALQRAGDNVYATALSEKLAGEARARRQSAGSRTAGRAVLEDRETSRSRVIATRLARATPQQAESTGLAATAEKRARVLGALKPRVDATLSTSAGITRRLQAGLSGTRAGGRAGDRAGGRASDGAGAVVDKPLAAWQMTSSVSGGTVSHGAERRPVSPGPLAGVAGMRARGGPVVGGSLAERRGVVQATSADASAWQALQR